jgi:hypothetical protein
MLLRQARSAGGHRKMPASSKHRLEGYSSLCMVLRTVMVSIPYISVSLFIQDKGYLLTYGEGTRDIFSYLSKMRG